MTIEQAADRLAKLLEKELKGLPAGEIKRRSEFAHRQLNERLVILMNKRRRYGKE